MDQISEARLSLVHPLLAGRIRAMAGVLAAQGIVIRVTQGLRTTAEQNALYAQGRTAPGHIVTNARGGYSMHNFGLAVDVVPGIRSAAQWEPNWDAKHPDYAAMAHAGKAQGLVWGGDWHSIVDPPHFQLGDVPVTPTDQMREALSHGLHPLWTAVDAGAFGPNVPAKTENA